MKPLIVADLGYVSPKGKGRTNGYKHLRAKLKYVQYRDDRDTHISQGQARDRWQDRGLGNHYRAIGDNCAALRSTHVLAWTWVISPAPDLMSLVPPELRRELVIDLTERVVEGYYAARGLDVPEYSFVLHDRLTHASEDSLSGQQQLHTHVILPGTTSSLEGRQPVYNNKEKGHQQLLHTIATQQMEASLDHLIGPSWRRQRPKLALTPPLPTTDDLSVWFPRSPTQELASE